MPKKEIVPDIERYVDAQNGGELGTYKTALAELSAGAKISCWIWYVLPQIRDPQRPSANNIRYSIHSKEEARRYLQHPVLAARFVEIWTAALNVLTKAQKKSQNPSAKFGTLLKLFGGNVDTKKAYHSLSTFALASLTLPPSSSATTTTNANGGDEEDGEGKDVDTTTSTAAQRDGDQHKPQGAMPPHTWTPDMWHTFFIDALSLFVVEFLSGVMTTCEVAGRKHAFEKCIRLSTPPKPKKKSQPGEEEEEAVNPATISALGEILESKNDKHKYMAKPLTIVSLADPMMIREWCALLNATPAS